MSTNVSWIHPYLKVREASSQGKGVFALQKIPKGERVAIFGGEIMRIDEIGDLPEEFQEYAMQIEERFVLGQRKQAVAEDTDFFNHSCDPNCGFKGQLFLVAIRDIGAGEELTFDYAMVISESVGSDVVFEMECVCQSSLCRKRITEEDWKLPALRKRYAGYFSQYLLDKMEKELR